MALPSSQEIGVRLAASVARIAAGDLNGAEALLAAVLAAQPQHAVALYLYGVTQFERGHWGQAENLFRQALAISPGQAKVCLHLAQCLRAQGRALEAEAILRRALADTALDKSVQTQLEHQLGVSLKLQRRHDEALAHMQAAAALMPLTGREHRLDRADLLQQLGRFEEAAGVYRQILADAPLDMAVHVLLNEIQYRRRHEDFLGSYDAALARLPDAVVLPVTKGRFLLKVNRVPEAQEAFRQALRLAPDDTAALAGLGRALDAAGDADGALASYEKALARGQSDGDILEDYAGFLLRHDQAQKAERLAQEACRLRPASQGAIAMLGLCYRRRGDPREAWLNDYQNHVQIFDLAPPDGYADMASFNRDLGAYLNGLHGAAQEYFTQTLRGGTQLYGELFFNGHDLVDRLLPRITDAIQAYAARLAADGAVGGGGGSSHPFAGRRGNGFRYAGSWSSRLSDNGFHVNHLHRHGWISSCYYVSVPDAAADVNTKEGWIKFGEPSEDFGPAFTPRRLVQPVPGRLVLFPSYLWHGTVPFRSPQPRITIAFDAIPA